MATKTKLADEWIDLDYDQCFDLVHEAEAPPWCAAIPFAKISSDNQGKLEAVWAKRQEGE